jgi:hypothetical protein
MSKVSLAIASIVVLASGAVVVGSIAASFPAQCDSPYQPGKASALVEVTSSDEGTPQASFPTPLKTTGRELSAVTAGSGEPARATGFVDFDLNIFQAIRFVVLSTLLLRMSFLQSWNVSNQEHRLL